MKRETTLKGAAQHLVGAPILMVEGLRKAFSSARSEGPSPTTREKPKRNR